MDNPSHIVPVMVGDPVHCKAVTDTLLDPLPHLCAADQLSDRAARHRAHAPHPLAGAHRRRDRRSDRRARRAMGRLPCRQRRVCEARRRVRVPTDPRAALVSVRAISDTAPHRDPVLGWHGDLPRAAEAAVRGRPARPRLCGGRRSTQYSSLESARSSCSLGPSGVHGLDGKGRRCAGGCRRQLLR